MRLLLFRASLTADDNQKAEISLRPEKPDPTRGEIEGQEKEEKPAKGIEITESDSGEEEIDWPQPRKIECRAADPQL